MPRPRISPVIRFNDVVQYWDAALQNAGIIFDVESPERAIQIMHRLNTYRKTLREADDAPLIIDEDRYIVRARGTTVEIIPRVVPDLSRARRIDGRPLLPPRPFRQPATPAAAEQVQKMIETAQKYEAQEEILFTPEDVRTMKKVDPHWEMPPNGRLVDSPPTHPTADLYHSPPTDPKRSLLDDDDAS